MSNEYRNWSSHGLDHQVEHEVQQHEQQHPLQFEVQQHEQQHPLQFEVQQHEQHGEDHFELQHEEQQEQQFEIKQEIKTERCELNSDTCFPPEFVNNQLPPKTDPSCKTPRAAFEQHIIANPWDDDNEEYDDTLVSAPKSNLKKPKPGEKNPRQCWLKLRRSWLKTNFMSHMIAAGNIRYNGTTFSSLCHHPSTPWDTHPLCWQCYKDFELPLCGYDQTIDCKYCRMMGVEARRARVEKIKLKQYERRNYAAKTALPASVYTQADADMWLKAKNIHQLPNPDWLLKDQPVGNCFFAQLIKPGQSVADAVQVNKKWKKASFTQAVKMHNKEDRPRKLVNKTISQMSGVFVPKCCDWEEEVQCEQRKETVPQEVESWASKLTAELEKTCKAMEVLTQRLGSKAAPDPHPLESTTGYTAESLQDMTPEMMRRVILSQQARIDQLLKETATAKNITPRSRSRASSIEAREMTEKILKDAEEFIVANM